MADNTYSFLKESGFEPSLELLVRKILATTEHGKRYHLNIYENPLGAGMYSTSSTSQTSPTILSKGTL